jgi:hypothetical protein
MDALTGLESSSSSSPFCITPSGLLPILIWNYRSYRLSVGLLGRGISPISMLLPTQGNTHTRKKREQASMLRVGFEPTIPVFEEAKTFHGFVRSVTVIGMTSKR